MARYETLGLDALPQLTRWTQLSHLRLFEGASSGD